MPQFFICCIPFTLYLPTYPYYVVGTILPSVIEVEHGRESQLESKLKSFIKIFCNSRAGWRYFSLTSLCSVQFAASCGMITFYWPEKIRQNKCKVLGQHSLIPSLRQVDCRYTLKSKYQFNIITLPLFGLQRTNLYILCRFLAAAEYKLEMLSRVLDSHTAKTTIRHRALCNESSM